MSPSGVVRGFIARVRTVKPSATPPPHSVDNERELEPGDDDVISPW